jgi:DNA-binding MarR family transcriptional regulator
MKTHYPSRQQLAEYQRIKLEDQRAASIIAEYQTDDTPPINYHAVVREKRYSAPASTLLADHAAFLRQIRDHPSEGLVSHYGALKLSRSAGDNLIKQLKAAGYIFTREENSNHPTGGRPRKIAVLTAAGIQTLSGYENRREKA